MDEVGRFTGTPRLLAGALTETELRVVVRVSQSQPLRTSGGRVTLCERSGQLYMGERHQGEGSN